MAEEGFKRKLAAILSADVEGYSRLMGQDEEATVRTLTTYRSAITDLVKQHRGRVVDTPGDNILAEFASVVDAVNCAVEIQRELAERNINLPEGRKMQFRIGINLGEDVRQLNRPDVVTWDLMARGWKLFYELTEKSLAEAETLFRRAVASTPTSCDAHHLLAGALIHRAQMGYIADKKAAISESYELAKRAIVLDERNEYSHWILGFIQLWRRKHELAVAELKRAIELNPNCSLAFGSLGTVLSYSGEPDESIKNNEIAIRLNPRDISIFFRYSGLAMAHFVAGRYSEAVQWARKSINRKPNWRVGHAVLAASLAHLNLLEEAKEAVKNYIESIPNETISKLRFLPFKNHKDARRFEEGLRKAGLPE